MKAIALATCLLLCAGCSSTPHIDSHIKFETGQRVCGATDGKKTIIWGCK